MEEKTGTDPSLTHACGQMKLWIRLLTNCNWMKLNKNVISDRLCFPVDSTSFKEHANSLVLIFLLAPVLRDAEAFNSANGGLELWRRIMLLLKLSAVSVGHSETDPKIKRSADAAQTLLARQCDELVSYFQPRRQQCGWRQATGGQPDNSRRGPGARGPGPRWGACLCSGLGPVL